MIRKRLAQILDFSQLDTNSLLRGLIWNFCKFPPRLRRTFQNRRNPCQAQLEAGPQEFRISMRLLSGKIFQPGDSSQLSTGTSAGLPLLPNLLWRTSISATCTAAVTTGWKRADCGV